MRSKNLIACLLLSLAAIQSFAAQKSWTGGGGDAHWENPNNWAPMGAPADGDDVTIDAATTVEISTSLSLRTLSLVRCSLVGNPTLSIAGGFYAEGAGIFGSGIMNLGGGIVAHRPGIGGLSVGGWTINNNGAFTLDTKNGSVSLLFTTTASTFNNSGSFVMPDNSTVSVAGGFGTQFINSGIVRKTAGVGTASFPNQFAFNNLGSVVSEGGTLVFIGTGVIGHGIFNTTVEGAFIEFRGATAALDVGTAFTGPGTTRWIGSATINIASGANITAENLEFYADAGGSSPTLSGAGVFNIAKKLDWTGGDITKTGEFNIAPGATLIISRNGVFKTIQQTVFNMNGTGTWTSGTLRLGNGAVWNNNGLFAIATDGSIDTADSQAFPGAGATFNNLLAGNILKVASAGVTIMRVTFNNTANNNDRVEIQTGTFRIERGGVSSGNFTVFQGANLEFNSSIYFLLDGARFSGIGVTRLAGGMLTVAGGTVRAQTFEVANGIMDGPGTFLVMGPTLGSANFAFLAGELRGPGALEISLGSFMNISGSNSKTLRRIVNNNNGNVYWDDGDIFMGDAVFNNDGIFHANTSRAIFQIGGSTPAVFNNHGAFMPYNSQLPSYSVVISIMFENTGQVILDKGSVVFQLGYRQSDGLTVIGPGRTLDANNGPASIVGGILSGTGMIRGVVENQGRIEPGSSPGTLTITNQVAALASYTQTAVGILEIEIAGKTVDSGYDQLRITGTANLAGTLEVKFLNQFAPTLGDVFTIATFNSRNGTFSNTQGLTALNGLILASRYTPTNVTLIATAKPELVSPAVAGGVFSFQITTTVGVGYRVESTDSLNPIHWQTFSNFTADASTKTITNSISAAPQRYFRIGIQ